MDTLEKQREFEFTDKHFNWLKDLVMDKAGISLSNKKADLVYGRLARRLRKLDLDDFDQYCELLKNDRGDELIEFVNSITTNLTSFFREKHHFEFLSKTALKYLLNERRQEKRLRIWSAGCSSGEEPYSIAMTVLETVPNIKEWDIKILATDIDTNILSRAKQGIYNKERIEALDKSRVKKWFHDVNDGERQEKVKVDEKLQELITFKPLNLMNDWPMRGQFDVLFCRNVVIYFNKDTQKVLFDRFANIMKDDAYMFLGHSESLFNVTDRFANMGQTIHRKAA